ncbi:MAG: hypothetical protein AAGH89_19095, partial [Verrucomicrobiota bacterium]
MPQHRCRSVHSTYPFVWIWLCSLGFSFLIVISVRSSPPPEAVALLQKAYERTVASDPSGAEAAYRELAAIHPEIGLPALARFLFLSGTNRQLQDFVQSILSKNDLSPLLASEILIEVGKKEEAVALLHAAAPGKASISDIAQFL